MADDERTDTSTQVNDNNHDDAQPHDDEDETDYPEDTEDVMPSLDRARMAGFFRNDSKSENLDPATNNSSGHEFSLLIVLQPDGVRHRVLVTKDSTVQALAEQIASDLRLDPELLSFPDLQPARGRTQSETTLGAMGIDSSETRNGDERIIVASVARKLTSSDYSMPDVLQVQFLDDATQTYRTIAVEITKFTGHKPYLGGFRHRKTLQIFHHASCQTLLTRAKRTYGSRAHRNTQTQVLITRSAQTQRESGTQMERTDVRLDRARDRTLAAKPYVDSYQLHCLQDDATLLIQRLYRGYQARHYVQSLKAQRRQAGDTIEREAHAHAVVNAEFQKREIHRRMHPTTTRDFEVLYNELDKWREVETRKVHDDLVMQRDAVAKQLALEAILAKETKLLQTIDRLKRTATDANRAQRIESMLQFMSRPKQWQLSDGGVKHVHTPFTVRATELRALYRGLQTPLASVDERLDVLLHVKWTVQEFEGALTREIVALIDREADMLQRGRKDKSLEGLRQRLTHLFLQFVENPEFNPEAAVVQQQRRSGLQ